MKMPPLPRSVGLFAGCVTASVLPALLLTHTFAQPGDVLRVLPAFWGGVLLGPWAERALYGVPLGPAFLVVALGCPPLMLAHPIRPSRISGALTLAGFALWYGAAFLILGNREAPV